VTAAPWADPADVGWEGEPSPPPSEYPPPTDTAPAPVDDVVDVDEAAPWQPGVDPGPIERPVTTGVEPARRSIDPIVYGVARATPGRAIAAARAGGAVARTAAGVGRAVGDRVFADAPGVGDVAQMGAERIVQAVAKAATGAGVAGNRWGRFRKFRMPWEP